MTGLWTFGLVCKWIWNDPELRKWLNTKAGIIIAFSVVFSKVPDLGNLFLQSWLFDPNGTPY